MSSTRPPCGLSQEKVINWRVNGLPAVFEGRCQNIYDDAEGVEQKCGKTLGAHPSELAGATPPIVAPTAQNPFEFIEYLLGQQLTPEQKNVLTIKFSSYMVAISSKTMTTPQAKRLLKAITTALCTETVSSMVLRGFVFDGMLGPTGQGKAVLYNVIRVKDFSVMCGKVYLIGDEVSINAEVTASTTLHKEGADIHPNIVYYENILNIDHINHSKASLALIMPLYQLSLKAVFDAFSGHSVPWAQLKTVAKSIISAGVRMEKFGLVHCDIKPDNIMLRDGTVVLIDLGSVVPLNERVMEFTENYGLDCSRLSASHKFDIVCLVVTLCCGFVPGFIVKAGTVVSLEEELRKLAVLCKELTEYVDLCLRLLKCATFTDASQIEF